MSVAYCRSISGNDDEAVLALRQYFGGQRVSSVEDLVNEARNNNVYVGATKQANPESRIKNHQKKWDYEARWAPTDNMQRDENRLLALSGANNKQKQSNVRGPGYVYALVPPGK